MENQSRSKGDYHVCRNCIMDTTDSVIHFDEKGVCDHLPQNHVIFASLYNYAAKHKIKYVLTGKWFKDDKGYPKPFILPVF